MLLFNAIGSITISSRFWVVLGFSTDELGVPVIPNLSLLIHLSFDTNLKVQSDVSNVFMGSYPANGFFSIHRYISLTCQPHFSHMSTVSLVWSPATTQGTLK